MLGSESWPRHSLFNNMLGSNEEKRDNWNTLVRMKAVQLMGNYQNSSLGWKEVFYCWKSYGEVEVMAGKDWAKQAKGSSRKETEGVLRNSTLISGSISRWNSKQEWDLESAGTRKLREKVSRGSHWWPSRIKQEEVRAEEKGSHVLLSGGFPKTTIDVRKSREEIFTNAIKSVAFLWGTQLPYFEQQRDLRGGI